MAQSKRRISRKKRRQQKRILTLVGIIFGALILILGGTYLYLNRYISKYPENKVADNIYVGSIAA